MKLNYILKDRGLTDSLKGKSATFALSLSNTATADIAGITQAGLPGKIYLTPTLDSEFLITGSVPSLGEIAETPKGVPTPALITKAVSELAPFDSMEVWDLGLRAKPQIDSSYLRDFDISPSGDISKDSKIPAREIFYKGYEFGKSWQIESDYAIVAESVPSGTTTATATALAIGYDARELFSSSFKDVPNSIRNQTIESALSRIDSNDNLFERLSKVSDNMLVFNAGVVAGVNGRFPLVLAGGTQMAGVLLVLNRVIKEEGIDFSSDKLMLWTTKWVAEDNNSDIAKLLKMLDFEVEALYCDFDFKNSSHPALKLYDEGEAKEGVGAGGALVYASLQGINGDEIIKKVEGYLLH